ncbi:MAG: glycerol-3-phosphate dehydrogenase, partial [Microcystaceae cyanobacterium]
MDHRDSPITILGAGRWGTELARLAQKNVASVRVWSRQGSMSLAEACQGAEVIVSAVSMKGVPPT